MKQVTDKFTQELPGIDAPAPKVKTLYRVYCTTTDGVVMVWTHLSLAQAKAMYNNMGKFNPLQSSTELTRFGWEEMV